MEMISSVEKFPESPMYASLVHAEDRKKYKTNQDIQTLLKSMPRNDACILRIKVEIKRQLAKEGLEPW